MKNNLNIEIICKAEQSLYALILNVKKWIVDLKYHI